MVRPLTRAPDCLSAEAGYSMMKAASINPPSPIAMMSIVVLSNFSNPSMRIDVAARHLVHVVRRPARDFHSKMQPYPAQQRLDLVTCTRKSA